jgi:uncharacterized phage protein gp47/JayE
MLADLVAAIPDAYVGEDGLWRITFEIEAGQMENLFLAHQILLQDMFIQTASGVALERHGEQYKYPPKIGTNAEGTLTFEGEDGTYIPIGTEASYDPGGGIDALSFATIADGYIPTVGDPNPPTAVLNATAGNLNGTYEYKVTFISAIGETVASGESGAVVAVNQQANLSAIQVGGAGVIARRIYRAKNGSDDYRQIAQISNNTATTYTDNITDAVMTSGSAEPSVDTSRRVTLNAHASNVGVESNVAAGTITVLSSAPPTLTSVVNLVAFAKGSDPEDANEYRDRLLSFVQSPGTGSPADLKAQAEAVNGVESATVFENNPVPGTVTVRISGEGGSIPDAALVQLVQDTLDAYDLANITIIVTTFTPKVQAVTADVTLDGSFTLPDVTSSVQNAVLAYINSLPVGGTLRVAGLVDAIWGLNGITDVVITVPSANVTCTTSEKFTAGAVSVV